MTQAQNKHRKELKRKNERKQCKILNNIVSIKGKTLKSYYVLRKEAIAARVKKNEIRSQGGKKA